MEELTKCAKVCGLLFLDCDFRVLIGWRANSDHVSSKCTDISTKQKTPKTRPDTCQEKTLQWSYTTLFSFLQQKPRSSFLIGSRPFSIRVQTHEADVSFHATQTLTRSLAWRFRFVVKTKQNKNLIQFSVVCTPLLTTDDVIKCPKQLATLVVPLAVLKMLYVVINKSTDNGNLYQIC